MKNNIFKSLLLALVLLVHLPGRAEDIDVFMGSTPSSTDLPNVLIIMDNTANWNTAFANEKSALVSVFNSLEAGKFNVGVMLFSETGGGNGTSDGGYVRAAMRSMTSANKAKYAAMIAGLDQKNDKSNGGKIGKTMAEAYRYFSGGAPIGGNKVKTDYTGNTSGSTAQNSVYALAGNALSSKSASSYNRAVPAASCAKNFIIYLSNGSPSDNASDTKEAAQALQDAGGSTVAIPLNPSGSQENVADEWARFMKTSPLGVTVYTLDIDKVTTGQGPGWTAALKSMADQSAGTYFDVNSQADAGAQIRKAMTEIFSQIQSVNSVFASVSLPISANAQGTYLDQVFLGMFRPDGAAKPRWNGNLKQYKLAMSGTTLQLQGGDGQDAIKNTNGYVHECAVSFWTPLTADTEWSSAPSGDCLTVANSKVSNYPDGNVVEKGAQAYRARQNYTNTPIARTVKTCSAASCTSLLDFNSSNVTAAQLGVSTTTDRDALINWAVGKDNKNDEDKDGDPNDSRLSMHGDVVHSRPVAVNYGSAANPDVVVFYGANDGMLRAVNGNRTNAIGGVPAGNELWSFMAPEFYKSIKRLRDNDPIITFPSSATGVSDPAGKPYGIDGSITAYKGGGKVYVYASMRRGGRSVYAFDVTNPNVPSLKWRIGCPAGLSDDTGCSTGMSGIGQTWSSLKPMTAAGYGAGKTPLLIMGGGYDTCEDYDALASGGANHKCVESSKGRYVYVIEAASGKLVKTFTTDRGVIADITVVRDSTGSAKYGYVADLGGNVYRIKFGGGTSASDNSATWEMVKIASLGCDTSATACVANRKFMFAPSVAPSNSTSYVVTLGSGDREKPLSYFASATAVSNYFFMFIDKPGVSPGTWPGTAACGSAIVCKDSLFGITSSATPTKTDMLGKKGWYLAMASGEQVVTSSLTLSGIVTFSTHQPPAPVAPGSCKPSLGVANVYNVGYANAKSANGTDSRFEAVVTGGLNASPVGGLRDGLLFCFGCGPQPVKPEEISIGGTVANPKGRLYWYIQK